MWRVVVEREGVRVYAAALGPLEVNTYIIAAGGGECILVDPGGCSEVVSALRDYGCSDILVLVTHGHFDHVFGVDCVVESLGAQLAAHPREPETARVYYELAKAWGLPAKPQRSVPDMELVEGRFRLGGVEAVVSHTPGHSPDHIIVRLPALKASLTGDLIFKGSVGRVDIPLASPEDMVESLEKAKREITPDTLLLPGHGPASTMREELEGNPFLVDPRALLYP
jgi:glyoxylase-like metal-dependent hydrolase (beta-lactamase superfamily II)